MSENKSPDTSQQSNDPFSMAASKVRTRILETRHDFAISVYPDKPALDASNKALDLIKRISDQTLTPEDAIDLKKNHVNHKLLLDLLGKKERKFIDKVRCDTEIRCIYRLVSGKTGVSPKRIDQAIKYYASSVSED